jgi:hypothetical protein
MYNLAPIEERIVKAGVSIALCLLATYSGITAIGLNDTFAEDKSTSITCTGVGPCEKTECINGDCQTTATNSSNITSEHGSGRDDGSGKDQDTRRSIIEDRLSMRER